jgi:hypothetical protein
MTNEWAMDPLPILRNARTQLVDVSAIAEPLAVAAPDVETTTHATPEMFEQAISGGLRDAVDQYRAAHPGRGLQLLRYIRAIDGKAEVILDAGAAVPEETQLVHLTLALTAADMDELRVVAEVLLASRATSDVGWLR